MLDMMFGRLPVVSLLLGVCLVGTVSCSGPAGETPSKRVIVLGFDGMDFALTRELMDAGRLPNLRKLRDTGFGAPLETSVPPLSPVAWSDFITGMDAGGHGIFDFIHRDPATMTPYLSTSKPEKSGLASHIGVLPETLTVGDCVFPLIGETQVNLRRGRPFWEVLEDAGIPTHIIRMPANFPPTGTATSELSGMGTPDVLGTYGTFSFYGTDLFVRRKSLDGGEIHPVERKNNRVRGTLYGPPNGFLTKPTDTGIDFQLDLDPELPAALLGIGGREVLLREGEWSPWLPVDFQMECAPGTSIAGIVKFYLKKVHPELELYATPVNIDPKRPAQTISTPPEFAGELAEAMGYFYTQGMMEDTKALTEGILSRDEFLAQASMAGQEIDRQYRYMLKEVQSGLLSYYFGNLDQVSHMMFRHTDPEHPAYDRAKDAAYSDIVPGLYEQADRIVGETLEGMREDDLLIVMSDHGFASWRRSFNLNNWLRDEGYLVLKNPDLKKDPGLFLNVDWTRTRAYGLGFNGLYLNRAGRERDGIVDTAAAEDLLQEIVAKLEALKDPSTGKSAVTRTYLADRYFRDREHLNIGPDLLIGYAKGMRVHSDSAIGTMSADTFSDNTDEWSGDHAMDHRAVPGVLFTSRQLKQPAPALKHLAAAILAEFGIENFPGASENR